MAAPLPNLTLHPETEPNQIDAFKIASDWITSLDQKLRDGAIGDASALFIDDCWWRDIIGLEWDWSCKNGTAAILQNISDSTQGFGQLQVIKTGGLQPAYTDMGVAQWIQAGFTFRNKFGHGRGLVRLLNSRPNQWQAWIVLTVFETLDSSTKVNGSNHDDSLQVLVVGAGQSGLALGAHLEHMGLNYLIVDSNARLGDSWRNRYDSITSHTPSWTDHYPFLNYPDDYPQWLDKQKMSDWQEYYAEAMNLKVQLNTSVTKVRYDASTQRYSVDIQSPSGKKTLNPRHFVLATGLFAPVPKRPEFPNEASFKGQIYHTSKHKNAAQVGDVDQKRVVVIGAGTSAHDVAQNFVQHHAKEVSMIQRHPIITVTRHSMLQTMLAPVWKAEGVTLDEADIIGNSFPLSIVRSMSIGQTQMMVAMDKDLIEGMEKAGLALRKGDDGIGLADYQWIKGGHFYIDQGACQMIVDGQIRIHQCEGGVQEFYPDGVILANGQRVPADVVVLATGFYRSDYMVEQLMGPEIKKNVGDLGYLDEEQERIGWWRPTGVPGLWYMTGSFIWSRQYSQTLAIQIKAIEEGLNPDHYTKPDSRPRKGFE